PTWLSILVVPMPMMVTSSKMSRSPVRHPSSLDPPMSRLYLPGGRLMTSGPGSALASWIASLNEHESHVPSGVGSEMSAYVVTSKVAAIAAGARRTDTIDATRATRATRADLFMDHLSVFEPKVISCPLPHRSRRGRCHDDKFRKERCQPVRVATAASACNRYSVASLPLRA